MNKYLLLSAAAAMATTVAGVADASSISVHFANASGVSYCDGMRASSGSQITVGSHILSTCSSPLPNLIVLGQNSKGDKGIPAGGKAKKAGNLPLSDFALATIYHENWADLYDLETPAVAGAKWDLWVAFGPTSTFIGNYGVLVAGQGSCAKNCETSFVQAIGAAQRRHALKKN
jgi:hypothetical protein